MEVEVDLNKSLEENASAYFERSKKAKKKLQGVEKAIKETEKKIGKLGKKKPKQKEKKLFRKRKREWFEKFHWFFSSSGFLVLCGRDATSNEALVKKYLKPEDLYMHADIQGAAHCIIKSEGRKVPEKTREEAARFAAVFSKAWQEMLPSVDVYAAAPGQVSKKAPSGEALGKGAFMIYGKKEWFKKTPLVFAIGLQKKRQETIVISGPGSAVEKHSFFSVALKQGKAKKSAVAKQLKKMFEEKSGIEISLDEIVAMLPAENIELAEGENAR